MRYEVRSGCGEGSTIVVTADSPREAIREALVAWGRIVDDGGIGEQDLGEDCLARQLEE